MFDFATENWISHLTTWYSFDRRLWMLKSSDPHVKAMQTFQAFTDRIVAALRRGDNISWALSQDGGLHDIYDSLPCFYTEGEDTAFRDWIKDATLNILSDAPQSNISDIMLMVQEAADCLSTWKINAYAIENLSIDPDDVCYFFRNKHAVKNVKGDGADPGEACWICTNDFDAAAHHAQHGPCGHTYCRQCFQKALSHAELAYMEANYTCAFCRSCLVCGASSCRSHVITREKAHPVLLDELLGTLHILCEPEKPRCTEGEPLYGLSPRRYWGLREQSRAVRVDLSVQYRILAHDLDPDHELHAEEEMDHLVNQLRDMAIEARTLTQEDEERARRQATFHDVDILDQS